MPEYLLFAMATAGVASLALWQWRVAQRRREALFVFATSRGWTFTVTDSTLADHWTGAPFGVGDRRKVTNVVRGSVGDRAMTAFDYQYDTASSSGENRTTHRFAVVVLGLPAFLPTLQVTPESLLHRVGGIAGVVDDIELESEDFNRAFIVSASSARFASDVLHPRTMQLLLANTGFSFRLQGTDAVAWTSGSLSPLEIITRTSMLGAVIDGVPEFVWKDHGASA